MLAAFLKRHSFSQIVTLTAEEYLGFLVRYVPGYEGMLLRRLLYKVTFGKIGSQSLIWPNVQITHSYNIKAGKCLAINYGACLDGRGVIEIGDYVLIGPHVFIGSSNHRIVSDEQSPRLFAGHIPDRVGIGSNVWIGANAVICPGVQIGRNSIIGAGSVVTRNVPEGVLAGGNPAKVIKRLSTHEVNA